MLLKIVTMAVLATVAAAFIDVNEILARETGHLAARQTGSPSLEDFPSSDCISAILDATGDAPLPPTEIINVMTSFFKTATGTYDAQCGWQTNLPDSLTDKWIDYQSSAFSWFSGHSAQLNSALSKCPASYSSSVGPCTVQLKGAKPTGASGGTGTKNAAPRETGYVMAAAAAMAGVAGIAAAF